ncbi:aryl-sulfate sulfotransferase [Winogradskyella aurantiaca]|uniref:aryl-sulfate sulfotransferase n=1 Tax=Winogradskyella aurantiaca TaxID=2219558 RepID=UPI000E1D0C81|nr:aryl-sulfate sulfotransferase [Winogradskyella aurantiaca]
MINKITLLILLLSLIGHSQNTIGTISIEEGVYDAYTLATVHRESYLINNCGEIINQWTSDYLPGTSVYLLPNGNLLRPGRLDDGSSDIGFGGQGGIVELFNWEGDKIWEYVYSSNSFRQHHDVYPLPNGNILILAATVVEGTDAIQAGRNPALLSETNLYNERIFEIEPNGSNGGTVVWEWNAIDHVIQDFDNTKDNFGVVADSPEKIDINFLNGNDPNLNWLHINSIQYNEDLDQIVISTRNLCEIWIIDHSTTTAEAASSSGGTYGKGGDLLYRWGNPQAYKQGDASDQKLFGQHTPYIIPNGLPNAGKLMVFNNGFKRSPSFSQVDIINLPTSAPGFYQYTPGTAYGPSETDFTFPETPPFEDSEFYSAIVSNAQQLPNGNILVCEGREAIFFELDNNNNIVWKYLLPVSNADGTLYQQGDTPPVNAFSFRAIKYPLDYEAFDGRDLTPGDTIEFNPDLSPCELLGMEEDNFTNVLLYPNPSRDFVTIRSADPITSISLFNINGQLISTQTGGNSIDLRRIEDGIYFVKISSNFGSFVKKLIKK